MVYEVSTRTAYTKNIVASFASFDDAVAFAHREFVMVDFEIDSDVDYLAADFLTAAGEIYSIQPA